MNVNLAKKNFFSKIFNVIIIVAVIFALYFILNYMIDERIIGRYYARLLMVVGINVILAVSLNLVIGFTGQLTLGHAGFMSIGAYAAAILTKQFHAPFIVSLLVGGIFAALIGAAFGYPILRLKGDYLAICTLGFGEIIRVLIENTDYLEGPRGISGIPMKTNFAWVYFAMILSILLVRNIVRSSQGRAMISIREDEIAAEAMGVNAAKYKLIAFTVAAFLAGIAGGLYAHYLMFINPVSFNFTKSIEILTFVVFGGMGSISGSVLATGVLTFLPEVLRELKDYRIIMYAVSLIVLMIFRPQGLLGTKELSFKLFKNVKLFKKRGGEKDVTA